MTAMYTWDVFCSLDGFGGHCGDWGAYWGKHGPELLERRRALYEEPQVMVLGANTFRVTTELLTPEVVESGMLDAWVERLAGLPTVVVSNSLGEPVDQPGATLARGDAADAIARLKERSELPLRSHGSLSLNRSLMAAGLVDVVQLTVFPVITAQTGELALFAGAEDYDLELLESRTLDGSTLELLYRPTRH